MNRRSASKVPSKPTRLFTQKDEIDLLNSLLNSAGNPISGGDFSKAQISDKIRRLKQKYHKQARSKSSIKTPHDRKAYELARKIWGPKKTRIPSPPPLDDAKKEGSESRINWSNFPFLMKQVSRAFSGSNEVYKQGLEGLGEDVLKGFDEKWMELENEEAALEDRRAQLFHNQLKSIVEASGINL
ncbi:hypothetical protein Salat_0458000 [Sesamum alatum]|uniref:Glabrous enhancer-binding protein-like DBD domain-containing protein n=1 Tax=Sesamum alatum TaxID=300844 RepID=A0AAE2D0D9_9LAMI|nr:hypothetical protein Salat_0458000 [Sesamum alatum]